MEKTNLKALYRIGIAYAKLNKLNKGKKNLIEALKLDTNN